MNIKNIYEYYRYMYNYVIAIIVKEKIVRSSVDQQLFHLKKIKILNLLSSYNPIYTSFFSIALTLFYNETQAKWNRYKCVEKFYNLRKKITYISHISEQASNSRYTISRNGTK